MSTYLYRVGQWCVRHRKAVVTTWVAILIAAIAGSIGAGGEIDNNFEMPGTESQEAFDLLDDQFVEFSGASGQIVFASPDGAPVADNADAIAASLAEAAELDGVVDVSDPFTTGMVSDDGSIALAEIRYDVESVDLGLEGVELLEETAGPAEAAGLQVEYGGPVVTENPHAHPPTSELIGLFVAVLVLLFTFGSVLAMGLPILTALGGLGLGLGGIGILSAFTDVSSTAPVLATMIGLAVGIDYALFIVTRHRQNLTDGVEAYESIARANATAGSAVVFAGGTVIIAIAALAVAGVPFLTVMGFATAGMVAVAVAMAVTLLPALLGFCGANIDRFKAPFTKNRKVVPASETFGHKWATAVTRRPGWSLTAGLLVMGILAIPALDMRLGLLDAGSSPAGETQREAFDLVEEGFGPGFNAPLTVVIDAGTASDPEAVVAQYAESVVADDNVLFVSPAFFNDAGNTAVFQAIPGTGSTDTETTDLVNRLRDSSLPDVEAATDTEAFLTGTTAANIDITNKLSSALPIFMAVVLGLTFLLLMLAFRSILVPIKASLAILLSIASSFGVVVAVFQWGWLNELVGMDSTVPILSFMPIMLFAILFGLSMDYEVFIMSRIKEDYSRTGDAKESVVSGLTSSARVITAAALIMISVFAAFVLGSDPIIKMFGLGLATAVVLDATIVRMIIVPAALALFDKAAWWLPEQLDRIIPNVDIEGEQLMERLHEQDTHNSGSGADPSAYDGKPNDPTDDRELVDA